MSSKKLRRTGESNNGGSNNGGSNNGGSNNGGSGNGNSENGNSSVRSALKRILKDLLKNNRGTSIKEPISIKKIKRD
ncbi:hypothetical protein [Peribacillus phoenicis]|uniref:hypothetical protein n=1 Tax=unclassified Peribacillus TaxID=2675266 RepID=UPI0039A09A71